MSIRRPDMTPNKTPMAEQPVESRLGNNNEVELGYTREQAIAEAGRCMNCPERYCADNCPIHTAIPEFIKEIRAGDFDKAYEIVSSNNPFALISSRVCPYERQCESNCTRGIKNEPVAIGHLERFLCDIHDAGQASGDSAPLLSGRSAAIVGSGPSGLSCALALAEAGFKVTVFEKSDSIGGVLAWGIPPFVLPGTLLKSIIDKLVSYNVEFRTGLGVGAGHDTSLNDLQARFDAVFLAVGAGDPVGVPGITSYPDGVIQAADYLANPIKPQANSVGVFGGGSTAIDAARTALRAGAKQVRLIYRRTEEEMPVTCYELDCAKKEGVKIISLLSPSEFITDKGKLTGVECRNMSLAAPDYPGGRKNVVPSGDTVVIDADLAVLALGFDNEYFEGIAQDSKNRIIVDEQHLTSAANVYAGGDAVTGPSTVIKSAAAGKAAAGNIIMNIRG